MPRRHFDQFLLAAQQFGLIVIVRNTNLKSTQWIERGYPSKPISIKCHTSNKTGKVTAKTQGEIDACRTAGFYVIDADGIARRGPNEALPTRFPFGALEMNEPGQVIDPMRKVALVGDYDLMGVANPRSKGSNLTLVWSRTAPIYNFTSPDVDRVRATVNARLDQPRIMHGAHDQLDDFPKGGATAFLPNGMTWELKNEQSVREFYKLINRETIKGAYANRTN